MAATAAILLLNAMTAGIANADVTHITFKPELVFTQRRLGSSR
jgi:hypothetical protein